MEKASEEEEETDEEKIEHLTQEIEELRLLLKEVNKDEDPRQWVKLCAEIEDKNTERILLAEKERCDDVVKEYFEENPHVLEAVPECPICFEKQWDPPRTMVRYRCCGKKICRECEKRGGASLDICPLCRSEAPEAEDGMDLKGKAESGVVWAMEVIGRRLLYGSVEYGVEKDTEKGLDLLHRAAENGNVQAMNSLGEYHFRTASNIPEARRWYEKAAAEGNILSLGALGWMIGDEEDCEKDKAEALRLLTVCTSLCGRSSQNDMYRSRLALTNFKESPKLVLHHLRPAAEAGHVAAMAHYGKWLMYAGTVDQHYEGNALIPGHSPVPEALFWFRQSKRMDHRDPEIDNLFSLLEQAIRSGCAHCHEKLSPEKPLCCSECRAAYYCDRECQVAHWKNGHKKDCVKKLKKEFNV